jgi:hypothetical protein
MACTRIRMDAEEPDQLPGARQGLVSRGTLSPSLTSFRGSVNCRRIGIGLCASTCRCMGITLDRTIRIKGLPHRPVPSLTG